jgi:hypothetical protein
MEERTFFVSLELTSLINCLADTIQQMLQTMGLGPTTFL